MDGSIRLSDPDRKALLQLFRSGRPGFRYAHVVLLVADGFSVREVRDLAYASFDLINVALARFRADGVTRSVVEEAEAKGHRVGTVVLIGGSSRVPLVRQLLLKDARC